MKKYKYQMPYEIVLICVYSVDMWDILPIDIFNLFYAGDTLVQSKNTWQKIGQFQESWNKHLNLRSKCCLCVPFFQ